MSRNGTGRGFPENLLEVGAELVEFCRVHQERLRGWGLAPFGVLFEDFQRALEAVAEADRAREDGLSRGQVREYVLRSYWKFLLRQLRVLGAVCEPENLPTLHLRHAVIASSRPFGANQGNRFPEQNAPLGCAMEPGKPKAPKGRGSRASDASENLPRGTPNASPLAGRVGCRTSLPAPPGRRMRNEKWEMRNGKRKRSVPHS